MTKKEYIKSHPKSYLANNLRKNDWPDDAKIEVSSGLIAPDTKQSKLYKALQKSKNHQYCIGGHLRRGTEGWFFAIY